MIQFDIPFDRVLVDADVEHLQSGGMHRPTRADKSARLEGNRENRNEPAANVVDEYQDNLVAARKKAQTNFDLEKSQALLNQTLKAIARQLTDMHLQRTAMGDAILQRSYRFVATIAEFVFQHCPELATLRLQGYVQSGLEELGRESEIKIFVHSSMLEPTRIQIAALPNAAHISVLEDRQLLPGDCRLEQDNEGLYASLHGQLEAIEACMVNVIGGNH